MSRKPPALKPIYDDTFLEGARQIDALAGAPVAKGPFVLRFAPESETIAELADELEERWIAGRKTEPRLPPPWGDPTLDLGSLRPSFADAQRFATQEAEAARWREAAAWALIASRRAEERATT